MKIKRDSIKEYYLKSERSAIDRFNCISHRINFLNHLLISVLTHILFVTFFNFYVLYLQVDAISPLLLNASLLLVLTTDYSD